GVDRIDDQDAQLGFVTRVSMIVERAERMERGEPSAHEWRGRLTEPYLVPVGRQHTDAFTRPEAATAKNGDPASQQIGDPRVGDLAPILAERHSIGKSSQGGEDDVGVPGRRVEGRHDARIYQSSFERRRTAAASAALISRRLPGFRR